MEGAEYLVGTAEIGELLDVDANTINQWKIRYSGFPAPVRMLSAANIWDVRDILRWAVSTGRMSEDNAQAILKRLETAIDPHD